VGDESAKPLVPSDLLRELTREARDQLAAIDGYSALLVEDVGALLPGSVADLGRIREAAARVLDLVSLLENQVDTEREEAARDPLTGVANRKALQARGQALFATHTELSVVLIDLDRFKDVNDRYGHLVGDEVLKRVVERCRRAVRERDLLVRLAGDEFLLLLPDTPHAEALRVAHRVRNGITSRAIDTSKGPVAVTASVGVACRASPDDSLSMLIERADQAMYTAKGDGRDRVISLVGGGRRK
jgi:diguanylate cyclase (GGDEF)-like protein